MPVFNSIFFNLLRRIRSGGEAPAVAISLEPHRHSPTVCWFILRLGWPDRDTLLVEPRIEVLLMTHSQISRFALSYKRSTGPRLQAVSRRSQSSGQRSVIALLKGCGGVSS